MNRTTTITTYSITLVLLTTGLVAAVASIQTQQAQATSFITTCNAGSPFCEQTQASSTNSFQNSATQNYHVRSDDQQGQTNIHLSCVNGKSGGSPDCPP
jgi:hypothetical protein